MKTLLILAAAFALYLILGTYLPITNYTAVVVTALGSFGAFTYKGMLAVAAFSAAHARWA